MSRSGGLVEALEQADVEKGLGRGGAVGTAVHEAVQESSVMGTAIFAVTIDGTGKIDVHVSSASENELGWSGLNAAIAASVEAHRAEIRMPPGGRGLRIAVRAEAKEQFPDGSKPRELRTDFVTKGPSVTETKDRVDIHLPEIALKHRGKVCAVNLSVFPPLISGGCGPENAGTVAQRIVTARVISESRM